MDKIHYIKETVTPIVLVETPQDNLSKEQVVENRTFHNESYGQGMWFHLEKDFVTVFTKESDFLVVDSDKIINYN